jgi:two-component system, LuxR family, response regulator FixJ
MIIKKYISVVDDDELVLKTVKNVLFCAGFAVKIYSSAQHFLDEFSINECECLVVDLRMPGLDGLALQQLMHKKNISLPVIFLSGVADINAAVQAMANGAYTFLQKPVRNQLLITSIQTAIAKHQEKELLAAPLKAAQSALSRLSERELKIALLAAEGLPAGAIAEKLFISSRTVEAHKASIFSKLKINTIAQLTRLVVLANYQSLD